VEKKAAENARYHLPNACETKIVLTMNARALLHFFNERCCERAQEEIRELAVGMLRECKRVAPSIFKKAGPKCVKFGKCPEGKMTCGKIEDKRKFFTWDINQDLSAQLDSPVEVVAAKEVFFSNDIAIAETTVYEKTDK
jgi:thymidylate synthase ThyX